MHWIPAIDVIVCRQKNIEIIQLDFGKSNTLSCIACEQSEEREQIRLMVFVEREREREKVTNDWLF